MTRQALSFDLLQVYLIRYANIFHYNSVELYMVSKVFL